MSFCDEGPFSDEEEEFEDVPFADPAIRRAYEAALGAFILAYNEMDYYIGRLVQFETVRQKKPHLFESNATFLSRLGLLEAFSANFSVLGKLPFEGMRELNADRNRLAHGYFDQNPFDGSYAIVKKKQVSDYPVDKVLELTGQIELICENLRAVWAVYEFSAFANPN